jgi:hypothetical protein
VKEADWDRKIWAMATSPAIIAVAATLQGKQIYDMLRSSSDSVEVVLLRWFLPLAITIALAGFVAFWGTNHFWSLTRMVLVGLAVVVLAQPLIGIYVAALIQSA